MSQASLAYRKNEQKILSGIVPEKYLRIIPHIPGDKILEIGSAEGVLALCLAKRGKHVVGLERQPARHDAAHALGRQWNGNAPIAGTVEFINGDIRQELNLLDGIDTLVAVRMIYYLRDDLDAVFAEVCRKVPNIVLCGNRNRADRYRAGVKDEPGGPHNFYASREGMRALLERHGYVIVDEVTEGDEIVVGRRIV